MAISLLGLSRARAGVQAKISNEMILGISGGYDYLLSDKLDGRERSSHSLNDLANTKNDEYYGFNIGVLLNRGSGMGGDLDKDGLSAREEEQFNPDPRNSDTDGDGLSECLRGTPYTVAALVPYTQTIVASPGNLHLSYFDMKPFEALDMGWDEGEVALFAKNFARQAFDRLTGDVQTAVSVAMYDVDRARGYLETVNQIYDNTLTTMQEQTPESYKHCDCMENSRFVLPGMRAGVKCSTFHRGSDA